MYLKLKYSSKRQIKTFILCVTRQAKFFQSIVNTTTGVVLKTVIFLQFYSLIGLLLFNQRFIKTLFKKFSP